MPKSDDEKSLAWVIAVLAVGVLAVGWGFMAGSYAGAQRSVDEDGGRGPSPRRRADVTAFVGNAIEQLPNLPTAVAWHFSHRPWLPILVIVAEVGVVAGGMGLWRVERHLAQPRHRTRRR